MEHMNITVMSVCVVDGEVKARVVAENSLARIPFELTFPAQHGEDPWEVAFDKAVLYLDPG